MRNSQKQQVTHSKTGQFGRVRRSGEFKPIPAAEENERIGSLQLISPEGELLSHESAWDLVVAGALAGQLSELHSWLSKCRFNQSYTKGGRTVATEIVLGLMSGGAVATLSELVESGLDLDWPSPDGIRAVDVLFDAPCRDLWAEALGCLSLASTRPDLLKKVLLNAIDNDDSELLSAAIAAGADLRAGLVDCPSAASYAEFKEKYRMADLIQSKLSEQELAKEVAGKASPFIPSASWLDDWESSSKPIRVRQESIGQERKVGPVVTFRRKSFGSS